MCLQLIFLQQVSEPGRELAPLRRVLEIERSPTSTGADRIRKSIKIPSISGFINTEKQILEFERIVFAEDPPGRSEASLDLSERNAQGDTNIGARGNFLNFLDLRRAESGGSRPVFR